MGLENLVGVPTLNYFTLGSRIRLSICRKGDKGKFRPNYEKLPLTLTEEKWSVTTRSYYYHLLLLLLLFPYRDS